MVLLAFWFCFFCCFLFLLHSKETKSADRSHSPTFPPVPPGPGKESVSGLQVAPSSLKLVKAHSGSFCTCLYSLCVKGAPSLATLLRCPHSTMESLTTWIRELELMYDPQTPFSLEQGVNNCVSAFGFGVWFLVRSCFLLNGQEEGGRGRQGGCPSPAQHGLGELRFLSYQRRRYSYFLWSCPCTSGDGALKRAFPTAPSSLTILLANELHFPGEGKNAPKPAW